MACTKLTLIAVAAGHSRNVARLLTVTSHVVFGSVIMLEISNDFDAPGKKYMTYPQLRQVRGGRSGALGQSLAK
jgi:hypothetical protein